MTRTITLTDEERRLIMQLIGHEWSKHDDARLLSRPDSPQEKSALADQQMIEVLQAKLR